MRPRARPVLALLLAASAALAGCIGGAFTPAEIPASALASGWAYDPDRSQSGERGVPPVLVAKFSANAYTRASNPQGAVFVITVSDVPVVDEQAEIKKQIDAQVAGLGIQLREAGRGTGTVAGQPATWVLSNAERPEAGVTLDGFAIDVAFVCKATGNQIRVFGFAVTEVKSVLGTQRNPEAWQQLTGSPDGAALGGMIGQVKCA